MLQSFYNVLVVNCVFQGMVFGDTNTLIPLAMQTNLVKKTEDVVALLKQYEDERLLIADILQNDVNQVLAAVLLWIQFTKLKNHLVEDVSFSEAEKNLKIAIDKIRAIHYAIEK